MIRTDIELYYQNYKEIQFLGQGTYGRVLKVVNTHDHQIYAAKIIDLNGLSPSQLQKMNREVQIHSQLKHINIIKMEKAFVSHTTIILITQYCEYGDLAFYIQQRKQSNNKFQEKFIMNLFIQILHGLTYLHQHQIIHRDIKPSNIFVDTLGRIKLADFGLSLLLTDTMTKTNNMHGTPRYLSPQLCLNQQATPKSDIWALGCVLYELCALTPTFDANNILALAQMITHQEIPNISSQYSPDLNALIHWMLEKDSKLRPQAHQILQLSFIKTYSNEFMKQNILSENKDNELPIIQHYQNQLSHSANERYLSEEQQQQQEWITLNERYQKIELRIREMINHDQTLKQVYAELSERIKQFHDQYPIINEKDNSKIKAMLGERYGINVQDIAFLIYQLWSVQSHLAHFQL